MPCEPKWLGLVEARRFHPNLSPLFHISLETRSDVLVWRMLFPSLVL